MKTIKTEKFGVVQVREDRIITFDKGLLGIPSHRKFALIEPQSDSVFLWMMAIEKPDLAWVVVDPFLFFPKYKPIINPEHFDDLGLKDGEEPTLLVMVNKIDSKLTCNLSGPMLINSTSKFAIQVVAGWYGVRMPINGL